MKPTRFHVRVDSKDAGHIHFTLFANGGNAGSLCLTPEEFENFKIVVVLGAVATGGCGGDFKFSGEKT